MVSLSNHVAIPPPPYPKIPSILFIDVKPVPPAREGRG